MDLPSTDEVNLVKPGFNSGWQSVMGFNDSRTPPSFQAKEILGYVSFHLAAAVQYLGAGNRTASEMELEVAREQLENYPIYFGLNSFGSKETYSNPELVTNQTIGPTSLLFLTSDRLGGRYLNTLFMGDVNTGSLYNFKLNQNRTELDVSGPLADKVANTLDELTPAVFGTGFGIITDLKVDPYTGLLYVLAYDGSIYRIGPSP